MLLPGFTIMLNGFELVGKTGEIGTPLPEKNQRTWTGITEGHYQLIVLAKIQTEYLRLISFLFLS